jgi:hypothetical protein
MPTYKVRVRCVEPVTFTVYVNVESEHYAKQWALMDAREREIDEEEWEDAQYEVVSCEEVAE